jgi:hypothetical protein
MTGKAHPYHSSLMSEGRLKVSRGCCKLMTALPVCHGPGREQKFGARGGKCCWGSRRSVSDQLIVDQESLITTLPPFS